MTDRDNRDEPEELEQEEVEALEGEPLPDREAMSIINPVPGLDEPVEFGTPGGPPDETW